MLTPCSLRPYTAWVSLDPLFPRSSSIYLILYTKAVRFIHSPVCSLARSVDRRLRDLQVGSTQRLHGARHVHDYRRNYRARDELRVGFSGGMLQLRCSCTTGSSSEFSEATHLTHSEHKQNYTLMPSILSPNVSDQFLRGSEAPKPTQN